MRLAVLVEVVALPAAWLVPGTVGSEFKTQNPAGDVR